MKNITRSFFDTTRFPPPLFTDEEDFVASTAEEDINSDAIDEELENIRGTTDDDDEKEKPTFDRASSTD